ncbi:MAG: hypothetical protein AAFY11_12615 [Cyanobacteria bacterium J06641_5]
MMAFFRSYIAPLLIVLVFGVALLATSARAFLPSDMMAPAPIEENVLDSEVETAAATFELEPQ